MFIQNILTMTDSRSWSPLEIFPEIYTKSTFLLDSQSPRFHITSYMIIKVHETLGEKGARTWPDLSETVSSVRQGLQALIAIFSIFILLAMALQNSSVI